MFYKDWIDMYLKWSPDEYEDIKTLRVPTKLIWLPDSVILNLGIRF